MEAVGDVGTEDSDFHFPNFVSEMPGLLAGSSSMYSSTCRIVDTGLTLLSLRNFFGSARISSS